MFQEPPFANLSPFLKIIALVMITIITFFMILSIGVAISFLLFGRGLLDSLSGFTDFTDPTTIISLKYFQIVNQIGVFIAPAILFVFLTDDNFPGYLRLDRPLRRFSAVFGILLLVVSLPFVNWLIGINNNVHLPASLEKMEQWMRNTEENARQLTEAFLSTTTWSGFLVNLFMIAVLAAVGEELVFRGILVRLFREWTGSSHLAVIIPAFLFSALHLQFYGFFPRFVLGVILGYLFIWSGSLWVPILVHFLNNAMAVVVSFLNQRGMISDDLETFGSSSSWVVILTSFIMMTFLMAMFYMHEKRLYPKSK